MAVESAPKTTPPEHRALAPDVALTFASKVAVLLLTVLSTVVVARALGTTGRGAVAVAFSFTLLLVQFGSFGLQSANPYFAARDPRQLGRIVSNSLWFALIFGGLLVLAGIGVKAFFPALLRGLDWLDVIVVLAGIPAALSSVLLQSILIAEGRLWAYNLVELGSVLAMVIGLIVGFAVFDMDVLGAICVIVAANVFASITYLALLMRHGPAIRAPAPDLARTMMRYGFRIYVATLIAFMLGRVNLILLNTYHGTSAAGLFAVCIGLAEGLHLLPTVVGLNLFPRVARGGHFDQSAAVFRTIALLFAVMCLITVPLAGPVITLLYGEDFSGATTLYYWLLPGIFAYGMLSILSQHFAGRGFPRQAMLVWFPGLAINLGIVFVFLPGGPTYVAALAASLAYILILILHVRLFASESGGYRVLVPRPREAVTLVGDLLRGLRARTAQ
jgi:O-antigen/teichoic acid export membrane protein